MKQYFVAGLGAALIAGGLIASTPPANAGSRYGGGLAVSRCDGPVQPDGTWQRCVVFDEIMTGTNSSSSHILPEDTCDVMGPDQHPLGLVFNDPPTHMDD